MASSPTTTTAPSAVILTPHLTIPLANGRILSGRLEHFPASKALAVFDDETLATTLLTVPYDDAPAEHDALEPDEVLVRNWTEMRDTAASLAMVGLVEPTGREVRVGMFGLQAVVARVL